MQPLFRTEAVAYATRRLDGRVLLPSPMSIWAVGIVFAVVLAAAVAFAASTTYAKKETVPGWLSPAGGIVRAVASRGGLVAYLHVAEGDEVGHGDPLATVRLLERAGPASDAGVLLAALGAQRRARQKATEAAVRGLAVDAQRLGERQVHLRGELADVQTEIRLQGVSVAVAEGDLAKATDLARRGHLSQAEGETAGGVLREARRSLAALERTAKSIERQLAEVATELDMIPEVQTAARADAEGAMAALDERVARIQMEAEYVVTAPISGRIEALAVRAGQSVTPGAAVAVVAPADSELMAELFVPSRAAAFIKPGQPLRLKYEAFPFERYGAQDGVVTDVSLTVLWPDEAGVPGLQLAEPVFRIRGRLADQELAAYGTRVPLRAGMLLTADIVVDHRTLVEWLLDPVYAVGRR